MPCCSAIALRWTGRRSPWLHASSTIATQAYCALADSRMKGLLAGPQAGSDAAAALVFDDVQAAFLLHRPRPAAGTLVLALDDRAGAGPAADARVALVVQRVVRHVVLDEEGPHVLLR